MVVTSSPVCLWLKTMTQNVPKNLDPAILVGPKFLFFNVLCTCDFTVFNCVKVCFLVTVEPQCDFKSCLNFIFVGL